MGANSKGSLGGGDRLARGARSASFPAGSTKVGDRIQINKGIMVTDAEYAASEKEKKADSKLSTIDAPVMKRKLRPLYDRVLVRKASVEEKSAGGILFPEEAKDRPLEGTVVRVGKGKRDINGIIWALDVKEGDRVLFGKYSGTELKVDGEIVLMLLENEIQGVIE